MVKLELVKHEQGDASIKHTVVAVSTSHDALVSFCKKEHNATISEVGCGKEMYFTIQETNIEIIPFNYE